MHHVRPLLLPAIVACVAGMLPAATLERLSMDDMVQKSAAIVRGRVLASSARFNGTPGGAGIIYTHYTVQVLERWKGAPASTMDIVVPGGTVQNRRQTFPGAPALDTSSEYVLFLWTSRMGLTHIIGLSQGLLSAKVDASGTTELSRCAASQPMIDGSGQTVTETAFSMSLADFRAKMGGYGMVAAK